MSYIDSNLMQGETVKYKARLHKVMFVGPIIASVVICALLIWLLNHPKFKSPYLAWGFILPFLILIPAYLKYISSEFSVTNKRVVLKVGFIRRQTIETLLQRIEAVEVRQSVLGRILNFGTISVIGTGGTSEPIENISKPLEFRRAVQEQADANLR